MDSSSDTTVANKGGTKPDPVQGGGLLNFILEECTFFRIHLTAFTFIPLICSGIFFACNGRFHISYVDSLFLCYSAMTVTGLSTINLSTITVWQQVMLYILMMLGDITTVSWLMVLVRKRFFRNHCEYVVAHRPAGLHRTRSAFVAAISSPRDPVNVMQRDKVPDREKKHYDTNVNIVGPTPGITMISSPVEDYSEETNGNAMLPELRTFSSSPRAASMMLSPTESQRPRAIDFAFGTSHREAEYYRVTGIRDGVPYPRRATSIMSSRKSTCSIPGSRASRKYRGLGGFPGPFQIFHRLFKRTAPDAYRRLERKLTIPVSITQREISTLWLDFDLFVGRNSDFHTETLSDEQVERIGGTEYRALRFLSYLIPMYFVGTQLLSFILFAPWLSSITHYDNVFQAQPRLVEKPWFSLFQVMGAYTGGGLSLVDLGMIPFQGAYLMIFALMFVILAGNHALPIFLRLIIWITSKVSRRNTQRQKTMSFLLQHPRRCFFYLFPSHQTWFLVICLVGFSIVEWIAFGVLNHGLEAFNSISIGPRIVAGLFQGLAARASGFSIVPIAALAPALQFLYVVMMYIAVYPVAMSIRATNVYEERSLGVFDVPPEDEDEEPDDLNNLKTRRERIGRYLSWHVRRQMSIDLWWLVWGVFLVAIIERNNLLDEEKKWFDLFRVLFELVSAFGGIGLSLGFPSDNFSFVGAMRPLSKLVVIVIMVRGRHRGLPVAVDRAVTLPNELVVNQDKNTATSPRSEPNIPRPFSQNGV
ncbi:potassium transporter [Crucibulum laeve]|uniref:Potassium transporter n=1 Tax=Crucibulum laeve TaxID=68775 RepID=A0A5C3LYA8_9AGAR|nr:potassium transporter [Crucibulum laeve]